MGLNRIGYFVGEVVDFLVFGLAARRSRRVWCDKCVRDWVSKVGCQLLGFWVPRFWTSEHCWRDFHYPAPSALDFWRHWTQGGDQGNQFCSWIIGTKGYEICFFVKMGGDFKFGG